MDLRRLCLLVILALPLGCGAAAKGAPPADASAAEPPSSPLAAAEAAPRGEPEAPKQKSSAPDEGGKAVGAAAVTSEALGGGQLTQQEIRDIVMKNAELFDPCYTLGAGKSQQFVATVTVKATIGPNGTVNETEIKSSTAKNKKVDACVADAFKKIKFPPPKGAATSVITFPMEFNGAEEIRQ
ncbi:MAG: TonB family protein [Polyangiaceae bacterium]|nr:TonB family protein [Polyangiaceae bacterium]